MAQAKPVDAVEKAIGATLTVARPLLHITNGRYQRSGLLDMLPRQLTHEGVVLEQHIREGRFQRSLSLIAAFSSLLSGLEVTYEHYVGSYSQRIMYTPVLISPVLLIAGIWGVFSRRAARTVLPIVSLITIIDGVTGFIFHIRGVARKPGGWRIPVFNIIMGPPIFAPLLFAVSGFLGLIASLLRREDDPQHTLLPGIPRPRSAWLSWLPHSITREGIIPFISHKRGIDETWRKEAWGASSHAFLVVIEQDVREGRFQRGLAVATALSAFFSGFESLYSHYKNNFTYKIEWFPILLTPIIMIAGIATVWSRTMARTLLPLSSALAAFSGALGFFYHARGLIRRPGGLKLPLYNLMYGPPIFAPLLFAATGFLGLLASLLRRAD
jgi:hypothetical protein